MVLVKQTLLKNLAWPFILHLVESFCGMVKHRLFERQEIAHHVAYMQQSVNASFGYEAIGYCVMTARYPYLKWWQQEGPDD